MFKNIRESKQESLEETRSLLEAKIEDQYKFAISKNKITHTDFLDRQQQIIAQKFLTQNRIKNYVFFGGDTHDAERKILLFFPEKFSREMVEKNYEKILCGIQIILPKDLQYEHSTILSGMMKLGIKREKMGDIWIRENGADIIVLNEVADFLKQHLQQLTRFKKAKIDIILIKDMEYKPKQFEDLSIVVSSMRLDNFVAELARTSRNKADEIINEQKVFVNYCLSTKFSKTLQIGDVLTIRGKGKFKIEQIEGKTKSDKLKIGIKKYC